LNFYIFKEQVIADVNFLGMLREKRKVFGSCLSLLAGLESL
jgi:hypothetical protein